MLETLVVPIEWKAGDDEQTLEGYASTFGNVDLGGDVVVKGAFTKTIANIKAKGIPLLADHVPSTAHVLGTIYDAKETEKGLWIKARFSKAPSAQDIRIKLLEGHLNRMSIGYETMDDAYEDRDGLRVRLLKEIKLWESSVVVFPMNTEAVVSRVKSVVAALTPAERKTVVDELAKADEGTAYRVGVESKATSNEVRQQLATAIRDTYGSTEKWLWVRDFDASHVWFEDETIYEQTYAVSDKGTVSLTGSRVKVRAVTTYVPVDETGKDADTDDVSAKAGDSTATGTDEVAPPSDEDATSNWDRYASEALLAGRDPEGVVDPAELARMSMQLQLMEDDLRQREEREHQDSAVNPTIRAGLLANLDELEDDLDRMQSVTSAKARQALDDALTELERTSSEDKSH